MFRLLSRDKRVWGAQGDEQILRTTEVRDTRLSLPFTGGARGSRTEAQPLMCPKPQSLSGPEPGVEFWLSAPSSGLFLP